MLLLSDCRIIVVQFARICYLFNKNGECVRAGGYIGCSWGSAMHLCLRADSNM